MKKIVLASLFLILVAQTKMFAQLPVPNGNFETWNTSTYNEISGWFTPNSQAVSQMGVVPVTKVTGFAGFAVRMETIVNGPDTAQAYITNSNGDPTAGQGGVPFTQQPTAISGKYRYNLPGNDTAILVVVFKHLGSVISSDIFKIRGTGSQNTFVSFSFPLSLSSMPDSVILAAASSNLLANIGIQGGSFLELDNLAFTGANMQIPNGTFESWTTVTHDTPDGWMTNGDSISKTTDSYGGGFAIRMMTQDYGGGNISSANITSGHNTNQGPMGGLPYYNMSDTLTGYYKYFNSGSDSASINVMLSNNSTPVGGSGLLLPAATSYTYFEIPVSAFSAPDTMRIDVSSSRWPVSPSSTGSTLYLDNLALKSHPLSILNLTGNTIPVSTYPNPVADMIHFDFKKNPASDFDVLIYNAAGSLVKKEHFKTGVEIFQLNTSGLTAGTYYYEVISNEGHSRNSFVKE